MTPTDQTPDAVRAAIAEAITASVVNWDSDGHTGFLPSVESLTAAVYDRLAQIGALRPVGERATLQGDDQIALARALRDEYGAQEQNWTDHLNSAWRIRHKLEENGYAIVAGQTVIAAARAGDGAT